MGGSVLQEHRRSWQHAKEGNCPSLASCTQQREKIVRKTSLHLPGSLPSMGTRQSIQAQDAISTSRTYSPKEPIYLFSTDVEKLQEALNKVCQERNAWRNKYRIVNTENVDIHNILRRKDELLEVLDRQVTQTSLSHHIPPASWIIDQLTSENAQLKKQKKMLEREVGSSSKF